MCPEEIDSHRVVQQRLIPEQFAHEESDDAWRCNGGVIVGDEQSQTRPGGACCIGSDSIIADQLPLG